MQTLELLVGTFLSIPDGSLLGFVLLVRTHALVGLMCLLQALIVCIMLTDVDSNCLVKLNIVWIELVSFVLLERWVVVLTHRVGRVNSVWSSILLVLS